MLKPLFSIQHRYLQTRNDTIAPETKAKHQRFAWVIARSLCHYRLFSGKDLPLNHRDDAIAHQIRQWSPFTHHHSYVVWQGDVAQVWIWDSQRLQAALAASNLAKPPAITLPESILRAPPALSTDPQARLITSLEGVEGQIWQAGVLIASRWWAASPDLIAWHHFCRAHAVPLGEQVPTPATLDLSPDPWGKPRRQIGLAALQQERLWVWLAGSVFILLLLWESLFIWRWYTALQALQGQIDNLSQQSTPLLTARNQAISDKQVVEQLLRLDALPSQIELLAMVAGILPSQAKLVGWIYQGGNLQVTIEADFIDPRFYVQQFQSLQHFAEVRTETTAQANRIIVNAQIVP